MWEPTVESVMTREVVTARRDTSFRKLVAMMANNRISAIPVIDRNSRPVGVVSEADTMAKQQFCGGTSPLPWPAGRERKTQWRKAAGRTAADLMASPAITIGAHESVTAAARRLAAKRVRRLCVIDWRGKLVGVVSRRDLMTVFLRDDEEIRTEIERSVLARGVCVLPGAVTVQVSDGVATLDGALERRTTAEVTGRLTKAITGVIEVRNRLRYEVDDTASTGL